jgi:hypothetical protein
MCVVTRIPTTRGDNHMHNSKAVSTNLDLWITILKFSPKWFGFNQDLEVLSQKKIPKFDEFFQGKQRHFDTIFPFRVYFSHFGNISTIP